MSWISQCCKPFEQATVEILASFTRHHYSMASTVRVDEGSEKPHTAKLLQRSGSSTRNLLLEIYLLALQRKSVPTSGQSRLGFGMARSIDDNNVMPYRF
jgi:hypothetical protein